MVNLTALAPGIVGAILDETFPPEVTLFEIAVDPPAAVGGAPLADWNAILVSSP
jgi:hypothetical protein